jgi:hypothetical protein
MCLFLNAVFFRFHKTSSAVVAMPSLQPRQISLFTGSPPDTGRTRTSMNQTRACVTHGSFSAS